MSTPNAIPHKKVAWIEGQFLRPQHFQQQERYIEERIEQRCTAIRPFVWGFTDLVIDEGLLRKGKIGLSHAQGLMPGGLPFSLPASSALPPPINVSLDAKDTLVYLVLPIYQHGNTAMARQPEQAQRDVRYCRGDINIYDDNNASKGAKTLHSADPFFHLRLGTDNLDGFEALPIAYIKEVTTTQAIQLDTHYIPTMLYMHNHHALRYSVSDALGSLSQHADLLAERLKMMQRSGAVLGSASLIDIRLLDLLNGAEAQLQHWQTTQHLHPEVFYQQLVQLIAQLSSFTLERRPPEMPVYQHNRLHRCLPPVVKTLRDTLKSLLEQTAKPIPLTVFEGGYRLAHITDAALLAHGRFILAAQTAEKSQSELRAFIENSTAIGERDELENIISGATKGGTQGIQLQCLDCPPPDIHPQPGWLYFELGASGDDWQAIQKTGQLAIGISGDATVPDLGDHLVWYLFPVTH